ncbi:ABC transporter permease [Halovivax gelatinilyticus]|uniref:ABC transporter permease n=1 Tax=Halovivax gelatinilyticus TaxID=2961597 RepID=UPI0020CA7E85|nr:ABC transporter permease [Halovivax gelatinilyticus]
MTTERYVPDERGRIQITGFDPERVIEREPLSEWTEDTGGETVGRWRRAVGRFTRNRSAMLGLFVVLVMTLLAVFARPITVGGFAVQPYAIAPFEPSDIVAFHGSDAGIYAEPSREHPMGTDETGRDLFTRVLYGGRYSISIGFIVVFLTATFGIVYGSISGYFGGWTDEILMRFVDLIFAFPGLVLALIIVAMLGGGYWQLVAAFSLVGWASYARLIRGEVLKVKQNEYVLAAKALGARDRSIIFKHVVPNALAPVVVQASLSVGTVVIGVAALGFLGVGFDPGTPEWGTMLDATRETLIAGPTGSIPWWATVYPGVAIFLFVMAMNLIGDGINDALDAQEGEVALQGGGG